MSDQQTLHTVYVFLERFHQQYASDFQAELVDLLSDLNPFVWTDGGPADSAQLADWKAAAHTDDPLETLMHFLNAYRQRGESSAKDITRLLEWLEAVPNTARQWWEAAGGKVVTSAEFS